MTDCKSALEKLHRLKADMLDTGKHGNNLYGDYLEEAINLLVSAIEDLEKPKGGMTTEQYNKLIEQIPFIPTWLEEVGRKPEELASYSVRCEPIRDLEREAREGSHWKLYKPGNTFEVTLVFTDKAILTRLISRLEWESLYFVTRPEALEDMVDERR